MGKETSPTEVDWARRLEPEIRRITNAVWISFIRDCLVAEVKKEESNAEAQRTRRKTRLFVEEGGLDDGGRGGFAAGDADYAKDGDFAEGGTRDEDAVGVGIEIGRGDLDAVVKKREQVVGDDTFEGLAVEEAQAKPEAVEFGAAEKGAALGFEVVIEIADEVDGADFGERKLLVLAVLGQQVDGIELPEVRGIQVATKGFAVEQLDNDLFVGGGWSAKFQRAGFP